MHRTRAGGGGKFLRRKVELTIRYLDISQRMKHVQQTRIFAYEKSAARAEYFLKSIYYAYVYEISSFHIQTVH